MEVDIRQKSIVTQKVEALHRRRNNLVRDWFIQFRKVVVVAGAKRKS